MIACISKDYLKTLLSVDNSRPISTPTFIKLYKKHKLHEVAGLSEREFKKKGVHLHIFFLFCIFVNYFYVWF